jgi:DNA-directed RNA polymerase specialized sigma24 family protein
MRRDAQAAAEDGRLRGRVTEPQYTIDPLVESGDVNALIADYEAWLHRRAWLIGGANTHDDLVQEGRIAMWQAIGDFDPDRGALPAWLTMKANGHMLQCITRGHWTGKEKKQVGATSAGIEKRRRIDQFQARFKLETGVYPTQQQIAESLGMTLSSVSRYLSNPAVEATGSKEYSLDELLDGDHGFENLLSAADLVDAIMLAYHRGDIMRALDSLSPAQKRYVVLRFWCGYQGAELKTVFGYDPSALWNSKKNGAKEKLRSELVHLIFS